MLATRPAAAGPVQRTPAVQLPRAAAATPATTPSPALIPRQVVDDCTYTIFSEVTITNSPDDVDVVPGGPGCVCGGGVIAGLWTDINAEGTWPVYVEITPFDAPSHGASLLLFLGLAAPLHAAHFSQVLRDGDSECAGRIPHHLHHGMSTTHPDAESSAHPD